MFIRYRYVFILWGKNVEECILETHMDHCALFFVNGLIDIVIAVLHSIWMDESQPKTLKQEILFGIGVALISH